MLDNIFHLRLTLHVDEIVGIISVDFDVVDQVLLIRYSESVRCWRKNGSSCWTVYKMIVDSEKEYFTHNKCKMWSRMQRRNVDWRCSSTWCWEPCFDRRGRKWQEGGDSCIMRSSAISTVQQTLGWYDEQRLDWQGMWQRSEMCTRYWLENLRGDTC